jgi:translation initiation factor 2B subunit (eIF-2B alpha/beta/delta family)
MKSVNQALNKILNDKTSGSTQILNQVNNLISNHINSAKSISFILSEAKKQFPGFALLDSYSGKIDKAIQAKDFAGLKSFIDSFSKSHLENIEDIFYKNENILKNLRSVITLSNSRSVEVVLSLMNAEYKLHKVFIAESRPKLEGHILAKALLNRNINVVLFTDYSAPEYVKRSDAVIIGADAILKDVSVINKTGSLTLAVLAKEFNIPFYVLAARRKFQQKRNIILNENTTMEVWKYSHLKLKITNKYFEVVNKKYITKILTD